MPIKRFKKSSLVSSTSGLDRCVAALLKELSRAEGFSELPHSLLRDLRLVMMEGLANAIKHGGANRSKPAKIILSAQPKKIEIQVHDAGPGFQLAKAMKYKPEESRVHGRGLWILKNLMDRVSYRRGRPNRLILIRELTRPKKLDSAMDMFDALHRAIEQMKPRKFLYDLFLDYVVELFNVERASLMTLDAEDHCLKVAASRGIPPKVAAKVSIKPGQGIAGYVFQSARPLLVQNLAKLKRGSLKPRQRGYHTSSFVSVPVIASPLKMGERHLGVLNLTDKRDGSRFTGEELKLLSLTAQQAASIFQIRDLIDSVKVHEGVAKELEIVREIQNRLLPQEFPQKDGLEIGGYCQLSARGGGDYYDVLEVNGGLRGVIADVSGHHVGSAITMASFRAVFRSLVYDPVSPGKLLQALRWDMHEDLVKLHQFISCWIWEYKPPGNFIVSGAGHPPLFHYREGENSWSAYPSEHLPLGLEDEAEPQNHPISLEPRDILFLYTDGLFDPRMRATGFDRQKFYELVQGHVRENAQALVDRILHAVKPHHIALNSPDDIAILAMRRVP